MKLLNYQLSLTGNKDISEVATGKQHEEVYIQTDVLAHLPLDAVFN